MKPMTIGNFLDNLKSVLAANPTRSKPVTIESLFEAAMLLKDNDANAKRKWAEGLIGKENENRDEALASITDKTLIILNSGMKKHFDRAPPDFIHFSPLIEGIVIINDPNNLGYQDRITD